MEASVRTLKPVFEQKVAGDLRGLAVLENGPHGSAVVLVNVAGALHAFDARGSVGPAPSTWKPGDALVAVGDDAFDPLAQIAHSPKLPKTVTCSRGSPQRSFSADASRMSAHCEDGSGNDAVYVFDTRSGAQLGVFKEFHTAAPLRAGSITKSGNFVFWVARSEGAFEEIKSHVTGPAMSSHSVMSPDERMLFTTVDRTYFTDDHSPATILDPKRGSVIFTLPTDVDTVFFSGRQMFAAHHSHNWGDTAHATAVDHTSLTLHLGTPQVLSQIVGDPGEAVFAPDESVMAVRFGDVVRVYSVR
jgi:hypothetical protein